MPELPEVEAACKLLRTACVGKRFTDVHVEDDESKLFACLWHSTAGLLQALHIAASATMLSANGMHASTQGCAGCEFESSHVQ